LCSASAPSSVGDPGKIVRGIGFRLSAEGQDILIDLHFSRKASNRAAIDAGRRRLFLAAACRRGKQKKGKGVNWWLMSLAAAILAASSPSSQDSCSGSSGPSRQVSFC
jgi:hypothetical protein